MDLTQDNIKLIVTLISDKLGPGANQEDITTLANEIINRLTKIGLADRENGKNLSIPQNDPTVKSHKKSQPAKTLILNAFGLDRDGLDEKIKSYIAGIGLNLIEISSIKIDSFKSLIAVIDYSNYHDDINKLKFDLDEICRSFSFKAIIQDSTYYAS
jgi:predicted amino acid-binding ACT domain protein